MRPSFSPSLTVGRARLLLLLLLRWSSLVPDSAAPPSRLSQHLEVSGGTPPPTREVSTRCTATGEEEHDTLLTLCECDQARPASLGAVCTTLLAPDLRIGPIEAGCREGAGRNARVRAMERSGLRGDTCSLSSSFPILCSQSVRCGDRQPIAFQIRVESRLLTRLSGV